jgi:hypothetical protein
VLMVRMLLILSRGHYYNRHEKALYGLLSLIAHQFYL